MSRGYLAKGAQWSLLGVLLLAGGGLRTAQAETAYIPLPGGITTGNQLSELPDNPVTPADSGTATDSGSFDDLAPWVDPEHFKDYECRAWVRSVLGRIEGGEYLAPANKFTADFLGRAAVICGSVAPDGGPGIPPEFLPQCGSGDLNSAGDCKAEEEKLEGAEAALTTLESALAKNKTSLKSLRQRFDDVKKKVNPDTGKVTIAIAEKIRASCFETVTKAPKGKTLDQARAECMDKAVETIEKDYRDLPEKIQDLEGDIAALEKRVQGATAARDRAAAALKKCQDSIRPLTALGERFQALGTYSPQQCSTKSKKGTTTVVCKAPKKPKK